MLGYNIRQLRIANKYSQQELAERLGVHKATISSWEVNRTTPNMGYIEQMAALFGVPKSTLIGTQTVVLSDGMSTEINSENKLTEDEKLMLEAYRQLSMAKRMVIYANALKEGGANA